MHTTTGVMHGSITHVACDTDGGKSGLQRHRREGPHRGGHWQVSKEGAGKWEAGLQEVWVLAGSRDQELGGQGQPVAVASSDTWLESLLLHSNPSPLQPSQAPSDTRRRLAPTQKPQRPWIPPAMQSSRCSRSAAPPTPLRGSEDGSSSGPRMGYKVCVPQIPRGLSARSRVYSDH